MKNWLNQTPGGTSPVLWHKTHPALQTLTGQSSFVLQEVKRQKYTQSVRFSWALFYKFFHFKTLAVRFLNWNWEISRKTYRNWEIQRLDSCSSYHPGGFREPGKSTKTIPQPFIPGNCLVFWSQEGSRNHIHPGWIHSRDLARSSAAGAPLSMSIPITLCPFFIAPDRRAGGSHTPSTSVAFDFCKSALPRRPCRWRDLVKQHF